MTVSVPKPKKTGYSPALKCLTEHYIEDYYSSSLTPFLLSVATLRNGFGQLLV